MHVAGVVLVSLGGREMEFVCEEENTELLVLDNEGFRKIFKH